MKQSCTQKHPWIEENPSWVEGDLQWLAEWPCLLKVNKNSSVDFVGWNQMLVLEEALNALEERTLPVPSIEELAAILLKCRKEKNQSCAVRLHAYMRQSGLETHKVLGNHLVPLLAEVGNFVDAEQVFSKLQFRNHVSWNSLIAGYVKFEKPDKALILYHKMERDDGIAPNGFTYVPVLKACIDLNDFETGRQIHAIVDKNGLLVKDAFVGNTLIDMYARCCSLENAQEVFDKLSTRDIVSWNVLLAGYVQHELYDNAFGCFNQMKLYGFAPDAITFVSILKACDNPWAILKGREIHVEIAKKGFLETNPHVGNALVTMYARCGLFDEAQEVFNKLLVRDIISWNALIAGYAEHSHGEEALSCFKQMETEGISPDAITYVCILKACGCIGFAYNGRQIHSDITKKGSLERDLRVGSTLVDMYAKCGSLAEAQEVFDLLSARDVVSWSALIAGYAQVGEFDMVFTRFHSMLAEGVTPNQVTFISVFSACCHAGLLDRVEVYFESMSRDYDLIPTLEHMTCLVDLLCRAGQLDKAIMTIEKMPVLPDLAVWHTVLGASQQVHNWEVGKQAFKQAVQLESKSALTYVSMSNICVDVIADCFLYE